MEALKELLKVRQMLFQVLLSRLWIRIHFFADPNPAVFLNAESGSSCLFNANPDPGGKMNADPDAQPCFLCASAVKQFSKINLLFF